MTAVASDNGSVKGVQFRVDGNNVGPDVLAAPYLYVLDSSTLSNGSHSITAIATDNTGASTTSASVVVKVDNSVKDTTPPTVSITGPANGAKVSGVVAVTANAADNVSVASVKFEIDGAVVGTPDLAAPFAYSWDTSKSSNGGHTLKAIATDGAGNSTTSAAIMVTVNNTGGDKTAPTVSITAPAAAATVSGTVNVTATASDNVGVASVQFQVDGVNAGALDGATPYALAWDTTKVANGVHRLDAIAKDAAGNATTSATDFGHGKQRGGEELLDLRHGERSGRCRRDGYAERCRRRSGNSERQRRVHFHWPCKGHVYGDAEPHRVHV